jgi:hypothetical protein
MIYSNFKGLNLSRLGFGIMRLPVTEPDKLVDEGKAMELIEYAYRNGVNYYDTAYFYHSGESERVIGKALAQFPRDTWYLADKMPGNFMSIVDGAIKLELDGMNMESAVFDGPAGVFERQLESCSVDYFDFYMLHNLSEATYELYTDEKIGIVDYLVGQKKAGRIRHLGISTHARPDTLEKFLNHYDCIEYAQIQLNYLDWSLQEAGKKYEILTNRGIPVIVMEPVRGGKLADPGEKAAAMLKAARPNDTPASWAFRFLQSLPNIPVVISGMTTMEQLKENISIFSKEDTMAEHEKAVLMQVAETFGEFVPCTTCRYCCGVCPQKLDIPLLLSAYNEAKYEVSWYVHDILETLTDDKKPQACTACGTCNPLCPQNIDIPETMGTFVALLEKEKESQSE